MTTSNVSAVAVAAGATVQAVAADNERTYIRFINSSLSDICISISQAAAAAGKGYRSTGAQEDFELTDGQVGNLVQSEFWVHNNSTAAATVSIVQGYRA